MATIIQLAGNNGVGKSYWLKRLWKATEILEEYRDKPGRKPIAYWGRNNGNMVAILGRFQDCNSGTDCMKSLSQLNSLIRMYLEKPLERPDQSRYIVFEGLIPSNNWWMLREYRDEGHRTVCIFIDEPPEVSIRNVEMRRGRPLTQFQRDRITRRYKNLKTCHSKRKQLVECLEVRNADVGRVLEEFGLCLK